jgi:hypothetical protein
MVTAHAHEQDITQGHGGQQCERVAKARRELFRVLRSGKTASDEVAIGQILGEHAAAVGRLPPEGGSVDGSRCAAPHHRMLDAGPREDLGHLPHVAELVGEIADGPLIPQIARSCKAALQIADE